MKLWKKIGIVLAGYLLALVAAAASMVVYDLRFTIADKQTMGGMIAGGEMIFGIGVFLVIALAPTLLALWFTRKSRVLWTCFTGFGLAFAILGLAAVLRTLAIHEPPTDLFIILVSVFGVAQMLGSPIWVAGFVLFAWLAPARHLRRLMLCAAGIEVIVGVWALAHVLMPWRRF